MKIIINVLKNRWYFFLFPLVIAIIIQNSNGMMVSERHKKIAASRAQVRKHKKIAASLKLRQPDNDILREKAVVQKLSLGGFKSEEQKNSPMVWVETSGGITSIEKWKVSQMEALNLFLANQGSKENPIQALSLTSEKLVLLSHAFDALANGVFNQYYDDLDSEYEKTLEDKSFGEGRLRVLISAAGIVQAKTLSALLVEKKLPLVIQKQYMTSTFVEPVNVYLKEMLLHKAKKIGQYISFDGDLSAFSFNKDHTQCLMGGSKGELELVDIIGNNHEKTLLTRGHQDLISFVAFNKNGNRALSASDQLLTLWNCKEKKEIAVLINGRLNLNTIAFSSDGNFIVAGLGSNVQVWSSNDGSSFLNTDGGVLDITAISWHPTGKYCIIGGVVGVSVLDISLGTCKRFIEELWIQCIACSPQSGDRVFAISNEGANVMLYRFDVKNGALEDLIKNDRVSPFAISHERAFFSPDESRCALLSESGMTFIDSRISTYDSKSGQCVVDMTRPSGFNTYIYEGAFSPDNFLFVVFDKGMRGNLLFFNNKTGQLITTIQGAGFGIKALSGLSIKRIDLAFNETGNALFVSNRVGIDQWQLFEKQDLQILEKIKNELNVAQSFLLYQLYLAKLRGVSAESVFMKEVFKTLPEDVQQMVTTYLLPKQNVLKSSIKNYFSSWFGGKTSE